MRKAAILIVFAVLIGGGWLLVSNNTGKRLSSSPSQSSQNTSSPEINKDVPQTTVIAQNLDTPWAIAFLPAQSLGGPDNSMLVTERPGRVRFIDSAGKLDPTPVATLDQVTEFGEGGLLGITLHPAFSTNHYVYLYYTYSGNGNDTLNRVVRMTYQDKKLTNETILIDAIPGAIYHNGGRIKFGPDGFLYVTTGDANVPSRAQEKNSLAGKILRVTDEGKAAPGNPFGNLTYSYGHRNPQGLAWDSNGTLWETEHGPSGGQYGTAHDEVNKIEAGKNYGWPVIIGDAKKSGMETPFLNSGTSIWAPAGAAITDNSLYFGGLRGQALFMLELSSGQLASAFKGEFGRIREVILGPDGLLYITTSNNDGRGNPNAGDDKVVRVNPKKL